MNSHIFSKEPTSGSNTQYYCLSGMEDYIDDDSNPRVNTDDDRVVAKAIQNKRPKHFGDNKLYFRYFIKMNPNFEPFDPIEYHSSIKDKQKFAHINSVCKTTWNFKEVDKTIFDRYILFLKTKSIQTLRDIERQLK